MYRGIVLLLLLFTGCSQPISVQMDYLSRRNLPSYRVGTPDPRINHPNIGERLIVQWSLPKQWLGCENLHLKLTVRYRTNEEAVVEIPITRKSGTYLYDLINECYYETGGMLTYKIELIGSGSVLTCWKHQLWAELILFQPCQ